jgi:AcrR family transcriptional regulator
VLSAASALFGQRPVPQVSLRDIARLANVQSALIARYIGTRDELLDAVFDELTVAVAEEIVARPFGQISFERDSVMGRWTEVLAYLVRHRPGFDRSTAGFNPVQALSQVIQESYGLEPDAACLRGAQIVASALGWRIFEDYLVAAGDLGDVDRACLRDELIDLHRRIGATPWPLPPDPSLQRGAG